ncbi:zinc metalloprotease [Occallatibacter riparius]|uniref:Uncharacterized protein n=1 Tax=Occallatibacter riparius TaxID=1002689 RepID=A0A9J7BP78_9BACT|nr:hypothetical protein [Occallatibacter riparius]UWZ83554.1 hypothetical protein MOP44_23675 [Occallatibacter riparius]
MNSAEPNSPNQAFIGEISVDEIEALQSIGIESEVSATNEAQIAPAKPVPLPGKQPVIPTQPIIPTLPYRKVSGRYRGTANGFVLELRVDIDGIHPLLKVSGDYFSMQGATLVYFGSFIVNAPHVTTSKQFVTITGVAADTWNTAYNHIKITIRRSLLLQSPAPATVQWFDAAGHLGASYLCQYQSAYFRRVEFETDRVSDEITPPLDVYNTGSLPSGGAARNLTVVDAYKEAGIELVPDSASDVIPMTEVGADTKWNDAELHACMQKHFSLWKDVPQWKVWEVLCWAHVEGPGLLGIMFDQQGPQRQGCAVFYQGMNGVTPAMRREQLYCEVHELGHCFNLLHSWQKQYATPPQPNRPSSYSWMNYPWMFPGGGEGAFWSGFDFHFDDPELIHLRHGYFLDVVPGGHDFGVGAALEDKTAFIDSITDNSGLTLTLSTEKPAKSVLFGEPVHIKLSLQGRPGSTVDPHLQPNEGRVQIGICRPDGKVLTYRPLIDHCVKAQLLTMGTETPKLEELVYCGYGKDGFYFDRTGFYQIRAIYNAPDGSRVMSNILHLRVRHPVNAADEDVADLLFGDEQGTLLYLNGSDSEFLRKGNERFDDVLDKHANHPLANYVRIVKGVNAARKFKLIDPLAAKLVVRPPDPAASVKMLKLAVDQKILALDSLVSERLHNVIAENERAIGRVAADEKRVKAAV